MAENEITKGVDAHLREACVARVADMAMQALVALEASRPATLNSLHNFILRVCRGNSVRAYVLDPVEIVEMLICREALELPKLASRTHVSNSVETMDSKDVALLEAFARTELDEKTSNHLFDLPIAARLRVALCVKHAETLLESHDEATALAKAAVADEIVIQCCKHPDSIVDALRDLLQPVDTCVYFHVSLSKYPEVAERIVRSARAMCLQISLNSFFQIASWIVSQAFVCPKISVSDVLSRLLENRFVRVGRNGAIHYESAKQMDEQVEAKLAIRYQPNALPPKGDHGQSFSRVSVPEAKIGKIIGPKGQVLLSIQKATGVERISARGCAFRIKGMPVATRLAAAAIKYIVRYGISPTSYDNFSKQNIQVPRVDVCKVIGFRGSVVSALKLEYGVDLSVFDSKRMSTLQIAGSLDSVVQCKRSVENLLMYGHDAVTHPGFSHTVIEVDSHSLGFVIDQKRHIQNNYKVNLMIPRKFSWDLDTIVVGVPKDVERAHAFIQGLIFRKIEKEKEQAEANFEQICEENDSTSKPINRGAKNTKVQHRPAKYQEHKRSVQLVSDKKRAEEASRRKRDVDRRQIRDDKLHSAHVSDESNSWHEYLSSKTVAGNLKAGSSGNEDIPFEMEQKQRPSVKQEQSTTTQAGWTNLSWALRLKVLEELGLN